MDKRVQITTNDDEDIFGVLLATSDTYLIILDEQNKRLIFLRTSDVKLMEFINRSFGEV